MTQFLILFCTLFCWTISFGQKRDTLLSKAYKSKSLTELHTFFENWTAETISVSQDPSTLNDTVKNVYLVFQSFYNPKDIDKIGGSEWGNDIYKDAKYFLIQDRVYFAVVDTLVDKNSNNEQADEIFRRPDKYDTLKNFRPILSFPDATCVVLTKAYDSLLNHFLGNQHYKFATGSIMSPARSKGESEKRKHFLENYIKIWYGHWGGYWQLHSYPYASRITFDKAFQNAVVDYRMVYEGGYAYFKMVDGSWTLISGKRTWIE